VPEALPEEFEYGTRCRLLRNLAEGGMGTVYLAELIGEARFSKTVALKFIRPERFQDPGALRMFMDEAKLVADLVHPNIVQVYALVRFQGQVFVIMEYVHGKTLADYLRLYRDRRQLPDPELAAFIISRVCRGLEYAHTKKDRLGVPLGVVHRDVTPANIMMDFRGAVKLTDFGIAKALTMNMPDETRVIMGKYPYMSPEQAAGTVTDARSDLFSLGLVFYELLTLTQVYVSRTRAELLQMMDHYRIRNPRHIVPGLPEGLVEIVMRALERKLEDRFPSAQAFGDALERHMYTKGYGPTNEKFARHLLELWPAMDRDRIE
jgi:serine/threonine-protein kinase